MGSHERSLPEGEEVVISLRPHGAALLVPVLVLLVVLAAGAFAAGRLPEGEWQAAGRWAVAAVAAVVVVRWSVLPWLRWLTTAFVVTDRRVTVQRGLLRRSTRGVPLSRVADVGLDRSLRQRLLGSGTLVLDTVGERGGLVVPDVPRAREVADLVASLLDDAPDEP